jgi:acyl-CoA dehydrogenase
MTPACHIFWAALWSGIAARLLEIARLAVFKKVSGDVPGSEAMRHDFSRLVDQHHTMNALIRDAVADFDAAQEPCSGSGLNLKYSARIKRLKVVCSELLSQIANGAMGLVGISGYAEAGPLSLSEPIRDAMSARVMISNYRLTAANVGVERYIDEEL